MKRIGIVGAGIIGASHKNAIKKQRLLSGRRV